MVDQVKTYSDAGANPDFLILGCVCVCVCVCVCGGGGGVQDKKGTITL